MENQQVAKASVKMQRISARKARLVADLIRNKDVRLALGILNNTKKKASHLFIKLLNSAIANATNNHGMDASKLFVKEILVNEGPTLKRYQPHSQGRAYPILKRTSHFSITLVEDQVQISRKLKKQIAKKAKLKEEEKKSTKVSTNKTAKKVEKTKDKKEPTTKTKKTVKKQTTKKEDK